jgi:hypothetical protein
MKKLFRLAACAALFCASTSAFADALYTFSGYFSNYNHPEQVDFTAAFSFTAPDFIVTKTTVAATQLDNCHAGVLQYAYAVFYPDAHAAGLTSSPGPQAIGLVASNNEMYLYYFSPLAFTTLGTYKSSPFGNAATLINGPLGQTGPVDPVDPVDPGGPIGSVPEPMIAYYLLAGLVLVGAIRCRRQRFTGMQRIG